MAERPVFMSIARAPFYKEVMTEFEYYGGFALSQKQKCIKSLHEQFLKKNPGKQVFEVSSKGWDELSRELSAFFLPYSIEGKKTVVECAFQGSKVFEKGGPYTDLYWKEPWEAKKDPRLKDSGNITEFCLGNDHFKREPKDYFYNWLYTNALCQNLDLLDKAMRYDAFTDIEFNPKKSLNCQARTAAIIKGLKMAGVLEESIKDKTAFLKTVYSSEPNDFEEGRQLNLFDL